MWDETQATHQVILADTWIKPVPVDVLKIRTKLVPGDIHFANGDA